MAVFLAGVLLGGLSGGGTYACTGDGHLAAAAGVAAALATWLGIATVLLFDD